MDKSDKKSEIVRRKFPNEINQLEIELQVKLSEIFQGI